ncbi:hypothetical protein MRX96_055110 [Rhipicephalus microplus]
MISFHMINEDGAVPNGYWGRSSYFRNYWLPIGTIGILTCDIVDNSKENWMDHWYRDPVVRMAKRFSSWPSKDVTRMMSLRRVSKEPEEPGAMTAQNTGPPVLVAAV